MERQTELLPGVFLTAVQTEKFKTGCFSINFLRPLRAEEASANALIPSVLLRGSEHCPDLRAIAARLDDLYGAGIGTLIRKKGEVQMVGFYADFIEDALAGEPVFASVMTFLGELLLQPRLEDGHFVQEYVECEKRNLANAIASRVNDKRMYATSQLVKTMCAGEAYAVPRLGELEDVEHITAEGLYAHYREVLSTSRVELFYMGRKDAEEVAAQLRHVLRELPRAAAFDAVETRQRSGRDAVETRQRSGRDAVETRQRSGRDAVRRGEERLEITQGKLAMGLRTGITAADADYPALLMLNTIFGGGITSKLFCKVREEMSLCYYAISSIEKFKGVMIVSSGVEFEKLETAEKEILRQLDDCRNGVISEYEFTSAKNYLLSDLKAALDSPGRLDDYAVGQRMAGLRGGMEELARGIEAVTPEQVADCARRVTLDTVFTLKGAQA